MEIEDNKATAEDYKTQGNNSFKKKDYSAAITSYSNAIHHYPNDSSYYGNRAACYLAMEKYQKCIDDCNKALDLDANFTKAYRRKALS